MQPGAEQPVPSSMDAVLALARVRRSAPWRTGVLGLRLEALGLLVVVIGLLLAIGAHDPALWTVVGGLVVLGAGAVTTIVGMVAVNRDIGADRPSDDLLRRALARDVLGLGRRHVQAGAPTSSPPPEPAEEA